VGNLPEDIAEGYSSQEGALNSRSLQHARRLARDDSEEETENIRERGRETFLKLISSNKFPY
jgi:hypothetical protein